MTVGFFSLFSGILPFTLDVDQTFIAAVLTIIGYSINDSVIIFDRIREYRRLYPKRELYQNINDAINSTLARTVNTSGTTFIVMLAIAIFGGEVIRGFAVALLVGIFVGTYSSVFVGTPIMYDLYLRKTRKEAKQLRQCDITNRDGPRVTAPVLFFCRNLRGSITIMLKFGDNF